MRQPGGRTHNDPPSPRWTGPGKSQAGVPQFRHVIPIPSTVTVTLYNHCVFMNGNCWKLPSFWALCSLYGTSGNLGVT